MLDGDDERLFGPVGYSLWVDLFGADERGRDAWAAVFGEGRATPERRLDRVLPLTGPVPWRIKAPLLVDLTAHEGRHEAIFLALLGAEFDYFGSNDRGAAREILDELSLPPTTEHLAQLRVHLLDDD
jgi:hypothetical protein